MASMRNAFEKAKNRPKPLNFLMDEIQNQDDYRYHKLLKELKTHRKSIGQQTQRNQAKRRLFSPPTDHQRMSTNGF